MNRRLKFNHTDRIQKNSKKKKYQSLHIGEFKKSIRKVLSVKWLLPLSLILGLLCGWFVYQYHNFPSWQTDASLYIQINKDLNSNYKMSIEEALSYTESILTQDEILQQVIRNLNKDISFFQLHKMISFEKEKNAPVLTILVTSEDAEECEKIANEILKIGLKEIPDYSPNLIPSILESASAKSAYQVSPESPTYLGYGIIAGLLLPFAICYGITFFQNRFDSSDEVREILQLPIVWEIDLENEESINQFCGGYVLIRSEIKKICLIQMSNTIDQELIQKIGDHFKSFRRCTLMRVFDQKERNKKNMVELDNDRKNNKLRIPENIITLIKEQSNSAKREKHNLQKTEKYTSKVKDNDDLEIKTLETHEHLYIDILSSLNKDMINIAKNSDDVMIVLEKHRAKRSHVWKLITNLQESGVIINSGMLIVKEKTK